MITGSCCQSALLLGQVPFCTLGLDLEKKGAEIERMLHRSVCTIVHNSLKRALECKTSEVQDWMSSLFAKGLSRFYYFTG